MPTVKNCGCENMEEIEMVEGDAAVAAKPDGPSRYFLTRVYSLLKDMVGETFSMDEFRALLKRASGHAGGKTTAEKRKSEQAARESHIAAERQLRQVASEGRTGVCVAFFLSADAAARLAIPGGEAPEDLHVTLLYLGDASMFDEMQMARLLVNVEQMVRWQQPLVGQVSGLGRFNGDASSDNLDVIYASVDMPGLAELRTQLVQQLQYVGVSSPSAHGFDPHITLSYIDSSAVTPEYLLDVPLRFDRVTVAIGDRRVEMQMQGAAYASEMADLCTPGHGTRLFNELHSFATPPDWIPYLPKPGVFTSPRYGQITITRERNERFVSNFKEAVYQKELPIDAEHETKLSGAMGWIQDMRVNTDGSVDARVTWTERGTKMIEGDYFKYFSPEWYVEWEDPLTNEVYKDVAVGGALTTHPFFKEPALRALVANEKGLFDLDSAFVPVAGRAAITTKEEASDMALATDDPTKNTPAKFASVEQFTEMQERIKAAEAENALTKAENERLKTETQQSNERLAKLETERRMERFTETIKTFTGVPAKHLKIMEGLAGKFGEDSEMFRDYVEQQTAIAEQVRQSDLFKERGSSRQGSANDDSAVARANAKARELTEKDTKLSHSNALSQVFSEDAELYAAYSKETSVRV